jgi:membrane-associated phospholipid phosphatase
VRESIHRRPLVAIAALTAAFLWLGRTVPKRGGTVPDVALARWVRQFESDGGGVFFTWVSWLGDTALSGLLVAAIILLAQRRRWAAAITIFVATLGGMQLNALLKPLFQRSRPEYAVEILAGPTWSFPSGHAMASFIGFGILAYFRSRAERSHHRRRAIYGVIALVIIGVGFSRLYLGVHYFTDVIGGYLAGSIWLLLCIEGYRYAARALHERRAAPGDAI